MRHISQIRLKGLTCSACQKVVALKVKKIPGVTDVKVDLNTQTAFITGERAIAPAEVKLALAGTSYTLRE